MGHQSIWECGISELIKVPKGTKFSLPDVWSYSEEGLTPSLDIEFVSDIELSLGDALMKIEELSLEHVKQYGADSIRQYFIEDVVITEGCVRFRYGT